MTDFSASAGKLAHYPPVSEFFIAPMLRIE